MESHLRTTGCRLPYGITCHMTQANVPALTPASEGWYSIYPPRRDGRLSWPRWLVTATTTFVPCDRCVNIWLLKQRRPLSESSSCHGSTAATRCCMALLLQLSRSCRELKTTSPGTSVSNADVFTLPLLQSLHWLPVHQRIQYKIAVITHKALSTSVPPYIDELLQRQVMTRSLRSTDAPRLSVPWTRTETAKRAFCVAVRTSGTHYRMTFVTPVHCERSVPNWKHFLLLCTHDEHTHLRASALTFSWHYRHD